MKFLLMFLLIPSLSYGLTETQKQTIVKSHIISKRFGYEDIIPVIIGIESSFGLFKVGDDGKSLGPCQMSFKTAKWHLKKQNITMSDDNLKMLLLNDQEFAIMISCSYFGYLLKQLKGDRQKAILAYNVGLSNVKKYGLKHDPNGYLKKYKIYGEMVKGVLINEMDNCN